MVSAKPLWGSAIDIWNLGPLILETVENRSMFDCYTEDGVYDRMAHLREIVGLLGPLPQSLLDLGEQDIVSCPELRLSSSKDLGDRIHITKDEDKNELKAFLMEVMVIDPTCRPTATQLIDNGWFESAFSSRLRAD